MKITSFLNWEGLPAVHGIHAGSRVGFAWDAKAACWFVVPIADLLAEGQPMSPEQFTAWAPEADLSRLT
ncbi:MAG: hypothetical protein HY941_04005, partial [Gammaproteobacteria bacterium]|nr:hypothetical protein [Gammaproteobacteria bacterium]